MKHSLDGDSLVDYPNDTSGMTIVGELNKLASNVSFGRNMAGIHYRCDGECGMKMGEDFAISYLKDVKNSLAEKEFLTDWVLEKFNGQINSI